MAVTAFNIRSVKEIIYSFSYDDSFLNVFYVCESQFYDAFSSYHKAYTK
jgi:hypothetical protein